MENRLNMKIINFPEANSIMGKNQPEYLPLPSYKTKDDLGLVTSCWTPTLWECIKLMFGAKIWVTLMTYNNPLQPQRLEIVAKMPTWNLRSQ